jgi:hypothetical protein
MRGLVQMDKTSLLYLKLRKQYALKRQQRHKRIKEV